MAARSKARKRALDVLYESELRGTDPVATLTERTLQADPPIGEYAAALISGVQANRPRIDELIDAYAQGWDLDRMPAVDRNILRIALFELLGSDEVPDAVAVDEAIELASSLSTDDSPRFVNGMLSKILIEKPTLAVAGGSELADSGSSESPVPAAVASEGGADGGDVAEEHAPGDEGA